MSEIDELQQTIAALESQRAMLGDSVVDVALAPLREKLQNLQAAEHTRSDQQRKQISVLFADVSGFTAMSETMDPEEVSELMSGLWGQLDQVILDQGGTIDKHIGDAVMALFGTQVAREDDPERTVEAALQMQVALEEFVDSWCARKGTDLTLQMRIGINTGLAFLGTIGSTTEYTAIGDTVNLASRLEHAAPVGGVLISHDTYQHVRGVFEVEMLDPITVKGKSEPIQVYLVIATRPRSFRVPTRGVVGIETKSVGRDLELNLLKDTFQEAIDPQTPQVRIASIVGDAGLGKSRLLYDFGNWMDIQSQRVSLFRARVTESSITTPYALIRSLCSFRFEIQDTDSVEIAREKLLAGFLDLLGEQQVDAEEVAVIGSLAGIDFSDIPALRGIQDDPQQIQTRAYHYLVRYFKQIMERVPLVMLLEDMHWADDRSVDFLQHLISECHDLPLFIVVVGRPSFLNRYPAWGSEDDRYRLIPIHPLGEEDSRLLVDEVLRHALSVPPELEKMIVSRAEGNPFYIEEVIKMLIQDGVIVTSQPNWSIQIDRLGATKIPATLTGVVQARLDRLTLEERVALQRAAVVGRVFWDHVVLCLDEEPSTAEVTGQVFPLLQESELTFRRGVSSFSGMEEFIFKNAVLLDVTYESVLKQYRRIYHEQVANWLLEHADRVTEFAGRIAEHFEGANKHPQAAYWYARAGKQAQKTYALNAAIQSYQKALDHWKHEEDDTGAQTLEVIDVYQGLGAALSDQARYAEAIEAYQTMRELADQVGDERRQAQALNRLVNVLGRQGDLDKALDLVQQAEVIAQRSGNEAELAEVFYTRGAIAFYTGEGNARELVEKSLAIGRKLGDQVHETRCLNLLAGVHFSAGQYEDSERYCREALDLTQKLGDRYLEMNLQNNLGQLAEARGDYGVALDRYQDAVHSSQQLGIHDSEINFLSNLGGILIKLGEHKEAEQNLRRAIQVAEDSRGLFLAETYHYLGLALLAQDKFDQASEATRKALDLAQEAGIQEQVSAAWRTLGQIAFCQGGSISIEDADGMLKTKDATGCFEESLTVCDEYGMAGERAETLKAWAEVELECGDPDKGQNLWQQARDIFAELGAVHHVDRMDRTRQHSG